ncbi:MAG: DNA polymerase beta superfamily protein [Hyphomicrobiales bacterium]
MNQIQSYLNKLEQEYNIEILLAVETGSRAWGFPSPDSDYDIRMIYKHPVDWYISIDDPKDTIELMLDNNEIDITGWDVRKSLQLLRISNAALLERIQSNIIYKVNESFLSDLKVLSLDYYSRISTIHHYISMAKKCFEDVSNTEKYKLKRFFYGLRAALNCMYILNNADIPPISFPEVVNCLNISNECKSRIFELIQLKSTINEDYLHTGEKELISLMSNSIDIAEQYALTLPSGNRSYQPLNEFLHQIIL